MVLIVFLQLPDVVRVDRLTRSDGFLVILRHRNPQAAEFLRGVINTISAIFMTLIAIAISSENLTFKTFPFFLSFFWGAKQRGNDGDTFVPTWP